MRWTGMSYTDEPMQHAFDERSFDMQVILPRIASLSVFNPEGLLAELVKVLAEALHTDRITHVILEEESESILSVTHLGLESVPEEEVVAGKVILKAMTEGRAQIVGNMIELPDLASIRADDYKTNGCAVLPLCYHEVKLGALCLSNLSATQVTGMLVQKRELDLFSDLVALLTVLQMQKAAANGDSKFEKLISRLTAQHS